MKNRLNKFRLVLLNIPLMAMLIACNNEVGYMDELHAIADQVNSKCPRMLDSETRLDGIEVSEPNNLTYKYTMVRLKAAAVDTHLFNRAVWPGLLSNIKVTHDMKKLRDNGTTVLYRFNDQFNKSICTITITPLHYK